MTYTVKPELIANVLENEYAGLPNELLTAHIGLLKGYCKNLNGLLTEIPTISGQHLADRRRRLGFESRGYFNHLYYFEQLKVDGVAPTDDFKRMLEEQAETSFDKLIADVTTAGTTRGVGWIVVVMCPVTHKLSTVWVSSHEDAIPHGEAIFFVDMWEHAYLISGAYAPSEKGAYIQAYLNHVDWTVVQKRMEDVLAGRKVVPM
ncbi:hypothetical protein PCE1_002532 [Barthelona sp. PCE]